MPTTYLSQQFSEVNAILNQAKILATRLASEFTTDRPRADVMAAHVHTRRISTALIAAAQMPGMGDYAKAQWGQPALDLIAKVQEIEAAADACADFIEANFPSVRSVLNSAMTALGTSVAQQNALRTQMGVNLDYVLTHRFASSQLESPTIPAASLAPLVTLLNALAAAATF